MATETTQTREMYLELADSTGEYTRILRVPNPQNTYTTKAAVEAVIQNSFFPLIDSGSMGETTIQPFFYDDYDPTKGLTQLKSVQIVEVEKTVNTLD